MYVDLPTPSAPCLPRPQTYMRPPVVTKMECAPPADMLATGSSMSLSDSTRHGHGTPLFHPAAAANVRSPKPSCPYLQSPHDQTLPSEVMQMLCAPPATALTTRIPRKAAMRANGALDASAPLETVFFGGGTPSLMPADEIKAILGSLREAFGLAADAEVSAEMDPGTFDEEKLRAFLAAGVNRVSLGVQSFDDGVLQRAGRSHDARAAEEAIDTLRRCGVPRWSADLISGLPGVDAKTWRTSLERVIEAGADHVSVYDLQVERGTAFYRWYGENAGKDKKEGLPSEDASAAMFRDASATLGAAGYEHYEVSSYAKPGARCKHNQIYWENAGWYGFGLSATSHVNGERVARPRKMNEYYAYVEALERGENVGTVSSGGDGSDALFEHIMLRLRTSDGLDLGNVSRRFGDHVVEEIREAMEPFVPEFAEYTVAADSSPAALRLTDPEGFLVSTAVLSTLISKMPSLEDDE